MNFFCMSMLMAVCSFMGQFSNFLRGWLVRFWATPGVDPLTNVASLGKNAVAVFTLSAAATQLISSSLAALNSILGTIPNIQPIPGMPPCYSLTPNQDGSMTGAAIAPAVPTGVTASGGSISWTGAPGMNGYTVQSSTDGVNFITVGTVKGTDIWTAPPTTVIDRSYAPGTQYRVASMTPQGANMIGQMSAFSNVATAS